MKKGVLIIISMIFLIGSIIFCLLSQFPNTESKSFEVTPSIFKVIVNKGETIETNLEIKNLDEEKNFELEIKDLEKIVYLEKSSFKISKENSEKINIEISGLNADYGTYMGHISVSNDLEKKIIPFVTSIHTPAQFFAINLEVGPEYRQLRNRENLVTNIKIFNLYENQAHTLKINYQIIDINGKKIWSESEEITVGSKASFTKSFSLPEEMVSGDYVFVASLNYLNTVTTSNYLFSITDKKQFPIFDVNLFAWIVIIFSSITFILILYLMHERSKLSPETKKIPVKKVKISQPQINKKQEEKTRKKLEKKLEKEKKKALAYKHHEELKKQREIIEQQKLKEKFAQKKERERKKEIKIKEERQKEIPEKTKPKEIKQAIQTESNKRKIKTEQIKPRSLKINPSLKRSLTRLENKHKKRILSEKISKIKKHNN